MAKKILITGGSGLVGTALTALLQHKGYEVAHVSRTESLEGDIKAYSWDSLSGKKAEEALSDLRAVVHLAGAGIADSRWTNSRKKVIIDSRVKTAETLFDACQRTGLWPDAFISASGINYYGSVTSEKIFTESDSPSDSFIGECCVLWEDAAKKFEASCRVAMLRTGVVLAKEGGALPRIAAPVKLGAGAALGSGKQYMPYIHIDDLAAMYLYAIEKEAVRGPYNAVNGDHITNAGLTKAIAQTLDKPLWLPNVPGFVLKLALGELSEVLLEGSRASDDKIRSTGYKPTFGNVDAALRDIYR
ncbi:MAG: TIGR01777 family oxidoreductase [Cryomorphaceae bacterium]